MRKTHIELVRYEPGDLQGTPGEINLWRNGVVVFSCKSLELPERGNQPNISCVPEGEYELHPRFSGGFKSLYAKKYGHDHSLWVRGVPDRQYILCHVGNRVDPKAPPRSKPHSQGCVLVGMKHGVVEDETGTGWWAVWNSAKAYKLLYAATEHDLAGGEKIPFAITYAYDEADDELTENRGDL